MSFFHQCAVGFFEPTSLVLGEVLRVSRPLGRDDVEALAETYLRDDRPMDGRQAMWWEDDGCGRVHLRPTGWTTGWPPWFARSRCELDPMPLTCTVDVFGVHRAAHQTASSTRAAQVGPRFGS